MNVRECILPKRNKRAGVLQLLDAFSFNGSEIRRGKESVVAAFMIFITCSSVASKRSVKTEPESTGKREIRIGRGVASSLRRCPFTGTFHAGGQTRTRRGMDRGSTAIQAVQIFPWIASAIHFLSTQGLWSLFSFPQSTAYSTESQALLFFKEALKVSDGILSSWDNRSDCCSTWEGISCNYATGHVELVNLTAYTNHTEQGLQSGVISSSLCSLPFLKYLILKSIGLTGNIPSCLGNLSYLQVLVLKNNSLTGIVPPAICLLTNLGHLDVSINQLVGILPPCLGNLTFLRRLIVHYNKLTGQVPISLNKLSLLKFLSISGNKFNGSLQLTGLSSLNLLFARDFSLPENVTSSQLALPSSIKVLWLSHITITDSLFDNLAELKFLYVSYCVLNISASWLPSFQLAGLDLVSCSIGGRVPEWLFTQYSLQRLALADDNIVGEIPKWLMENNPQLFLFNI
ncbi:receptor-like protein 35 [Cryptomeria japonica]|uniref:receptor-like protein 35 n=1 Tax=Cryptomeria japonica TaxID=3369 RepID=UPI0027DA862F|nr:receptor-like protein 35 [Cryptomeria japonica]